MFGLSISMRYLVNLTLLLHFKIQKNNQIRAKSLKVTTKCFFDHKISQNIDWKQPPILYHLAWNWRHWLFRKQKDFGKNTYVEISKFDSQSKIWKIYDENLISWPREEWSTTKRPSWETCIGLDFKV